MQHTLTTMEEQIILKAIREECRWDSLPKRLQVMLTSKEEWHKRIVEHCIKKRLQWNNCFARTVCREGEYYEELMRYLRKNLALFPYHLAEYICRVMRISPFRYYCDILFEVMKNEQPYDSIPNFSAADILRLTGVGRNEFIDIMNKCKSKKIMWKLNKSIAKEFLPTQCIDFPIEPWWRICLVNFTLEEFKRLSDEESTMVDKVCNEEANSFFLFDVDIVRGLYYRGLIYFDVPVQADDRFKVSRLEGFVSNREQSYEDPIEELLYAVFVVSNENATVSELAATLQADLIPLQAAASFACRLGWAHKVIDPTFILRDSSISDFSALTINGEGDAFHVTEFPESVSSDHIGHNDSASRKNISSSGNTRVAFIVSADIASYLMMGSVSPGLKSHAVTLYEAGKLGDASIEDLCKDLGSLEDAKFEGGLQEFADHVFSLRYALECLHSGGVSSPSSSSDGAGAKKKKTFHLDLLRCESLAALAPVTLDSLFLRDYDILVSMIPLPFSAAVLPGPAFPLHFGPPSYSSMSPWMKLVLYTSMGCGPLSVVIMKGHCLRSLPSSLSDCDKAILWSWDDSMGWARFGGGLIQGSTILHHLNSLLKRTAVLVQPLRSSDLDGSGNPVTVDLPLPLKGADGAVAPIGDDIVLCGEEREELNLLIADLSDELGLETVGYVRFLRLFNNTTGHKWVLLNVEFGIPLSDPLLCRRICDRVVLSEILRAGSSIAYRYATRRLRKKLADICAEFRVTGDTAKLVYERRKPGKENKVRDETLVSSSFSGIRTEKRKQEASSRRCCSREVLSFDGRDVRSYILEEGGTEETEDVKYEDDGKEVLLPGLDLLFDGLELHVFDMGPCFQAHQPVTLIADAFLATTASIFPNI